MKLTLYYRKTCPFCQKVLDHMRKLEIDLPLKEVTTDNKEELISIGGKSQVPCLVVDGRPIYESDDIIQWLSENVNEIKKP